MRLKIDLKIFIFLIIFYFTKQIELYGLVMVFCILHELGHLIAGLLLKMKPKKIEIMPWGFSIGFKLIPEDYNNKILKSNKLELKKVLIAMAGPLVNCILIILFFYIKTNLTDTIIYSNMIVLIFNLIPIYPLDGGRILKSTLKIVNGSIRAERISNMINNISIIIITMLCGFTIYILKNIAILIILVYWWYLVIEENKDYMLKKDIYNRIKRAKSVQ